MRPELVGVIVIVAGWAVVEIVGRLVQLRRRRLLRERWGRPPEDRRLPPALARCLHDLLGPEQDQLVWTLDDRTWSDLDLDTVRERLDHTLTPIGAQALYRLLRTPLLNSEPLNHRQQQIARLRNDAELRERIQLTLLHAREHDLAYLAETLWAQQPARFWWQTAVPFLSLAPIITVVAAVFGVIGWSPTFFAVALNIAIHFVHQMRVEALPLRQLGGLLNAAHGLVASDHELAPDAVAAIVHGLERTRPARRRLALLQIEDGIGLAQYLRVLLLLDVAAWCAAAEAVRTAAEELRRLLLAVGEIDVLVALASWSEGMSSMSAPNFVPDIAQALVTELRHPLLVDPVPCSLHFDRHGVLVTGSNMSGKTTFLKSIGTNAVLAQTVGIVTAERWRMPMLRPVAAIGRADNLIEGKSYYLAEVEAVARMVRATASGHPRAGIHLFLADELFRGTNAIERIAGAAAVLVHLANHGDLVFAATHDLELTELLGDAYRSFHFGEGFDDAGLRFDYRLRHGIATGRTAIALLELTGYPEAVVTEARRLVEQLDKS